ncbi:MAG: 6-phosphogluconolactonase [Halioglobus sp.]
MLPRIHRFTSQALLIEALYSRIGALAKRCCAERGRFSVVLAGGTTPQLLYQQLRNLDTDWTCWHIYFGDERYLPEDNPERNASMAAAAWLDHVPIPPTQIHTVHYGDDVHSAARAYAHVLAQAPGIDLALLGLGEDGHTASLFPGNETALASTELAIAVTDAPKPPPQRVTMTARSLSSAAAVWFLVTGSAKLQALQNWLAGAPLPPQSICPVSGLDLFTDLALPNAITPERN